MYRIFLARVGGVSMGDKKKVDVEEWKEILRTVFEKMFQLHMSEREIVSMFHECIESIRKDCNKYHTYNDSVFQMVFRDKKNLLSLYNALNHSEYTDTDALVVVNLDGCWFVFIILPKVRINYCKNVLHWKNIRYLLIL